jgi:hypothetical protein
MTAEPEVIPAPAGRAPIKCDMRLVAMVPKAIGKRLQLIAKFEGRPVGHVLTELLLGRREFPTSEQLGDQMRQIGGSGDDDN